MKPKKKLSLTHNLNLYSLALDWLDENQASLSGKQIVSVGEEHELDTLEAQVSMEGSEIQIRTATGVLTGHAVKNSDGLWISIGDQTAFFSQPTRDSAGESEADSETEIHAPMTGKIVDVRARTNQAVSEGEILVILEAMKMEFKLEAAIEGVVESVNCEVGELVDLGQLLVKLAPAEESA